ncbi:MAG: TonB-dependent receptor [Sphingobium sp.]
MQKSWYLGTGAALSLLTVSQPALAQSDGTQDTNDIVVTARRVEERLQDVPISITVFNQQQLTNRNVVSAGDIATYTPSLSASSRFGGENTSFAIRGFVQDNGTSPSVAVYFADVTALRAAGGTTLGNGAGPGAFFDLQNLQVLKGAQGTLFGRNTTGGAVLLVPQKPTGKFEGYVETSVGNYDMRRVQAVLNIPVMDTLRIRVGFDRQTRDGYLNNYSGIGPSDFADTDYWAARFSAVADLTPNLENYFIGTYSNSDTNGFLPQIFTCAPGLLAVPGTASAAERASAATKTYLANLACNQVARNKARGDYYGVENSTPSPRQHVQQFQLINTTTWHATDHLTIKNIASYGELRVFFRSSVYGENLIIPAGDGANAGRSIIVSQTSPGPGQNSAAQSTFSEELQFQGDGFGNKLKWQGGFYTELSEPLGFSGSVSANTALCTTTNNYECTDTGIPAASSGGATIRSNDIMRLNKQRFENYGIYGQVTYDFTDKLSATGGLRYTWDSTTAITRQVAYPLPLANPSTPAGVCLTGPNAGKTPPPFFTDAQCEQTFHIARSRPTWLVDIDFKPTDDILLYAKYTRGYRAGGIKTDGGAAFALFEPEKVDTYEAGIKTSWRGPVRGTFNVTGFYSDFSDQQLASRLDPRPDGPAAGTSPNQVIASVGQSRIYGAEVEASVTPFKGLTIDGSYAYLNTKLKSISASAGDSAIYFPPIPSGTAVGYPLGLAPKNKYTVTASYTLPLDEDIGKVSIAATYSHSDSMLTTAGYIIPITAATATAPNPPTPINGNLVSGLAPIPNYGVIPAVGLLNVNVNWTSVGGGAIDLGFFMTNVTNQKYVTSVNGGIGAFGYDAHTLGEPRMYGFRAKVRF